MRPRLGKKLIIAIFGIWTALATQDAEPEPELDWEE